MTKDKKILYGISIALCAALLAALLLCEWNGKIAAAILLTVFAVAICLLVRKRPSLSVNKKEVLLLSTIWGILFVVTVQIIGLVTASYKNPYFIKADTLLTTVLPLIAIIVASEIIRCVLLAQKSTAVNVLAFVACVMAEVLMLSGLAKITDFNHFMDLVGLTLFPAITGNL